ncbi:MAG: Homoserine O-acetyltransferase [Methanonatronarchaeales archaeon]|nr:Homoserine O-acetyltransferase [Methanonatronarchaeales archaeon]
MKTVGELMSTDLVTASVPGTRDQVLERMHNQNVSCVPVVERGGSRLVGIVTRSDLLRGVEEEQIALIMTRGPVTAEVDDPVDSAVEKMMERGIRRLPVIEGEDIIGMLSVADLVGEVDSETDISGLYESRVCGVWEETPIPVAATVMQLGGDDSAIVLNDEGVLTGILSETDLVRSASIEDSVRSNNIGSGEEDDGWAWEGFRDNIMIYHGVSRIDFPEEPVSEIMTRDVITKYARSTAAVAARDLVKSEIEQIPVVNEDNEVVGLLRDRDLIPLLI